MSGTKESSENILLVNPWSPLILDRWVDVAYAVNWLLLAGWGLMATIFGITTVVDSAGHLYNFIWSGAIGTLSSLAALAAISMFFNLPYFTPLRKKKIEMALVAGLLPFIAVYPVLLTVASIQGDDTRLPLSVLGYSFLVFPTLRLWILRLRIKAIERFQVKLNDDVK